MAHIEIVGAMCLQLSENADPEEIKAAGFDSYFVDHGTGVYPCSAAGVPFNAACLASKGDPITDLWAFMRGQHFHILYKRALFFDFKHKNYLWIYIITLV